MIYDSSAYKEELGHIYTRMYNRQEQKRWPDRSFFLLEKDFFIAFFLIRKLIEARTKLTEKIASQSVKLIAYKSTGKNSTVLTNHRLQEFYDFKSGININKDIGFVCNQAVHSYAFAPVLSDKTNGISGIIFNSFNQKQVALYRISIKEILRILHSVSNCYMTTMNIKFDPVTGDFTVLSE